MAFNPAFKAILFDADGVLFDACDVHYQALNKALSFFGVSIPENDHKSNFNGLPTYAKLDKLVKLSRLDPANVAPVQKLKQHFTQEELKAKLKYDKEKCMLLRDLREHGYLTGICSNCQSDTLYLMLDKTGMRGEIDLVLSASNQGFMSPKPAADVYTTALRILGCAIYDALAIEDTDLGVQAAKAAQMTHIHKVKDQSEVTREFFVKLNLLPELPGKAKAQAE